MASGIGRRRATALGDGGDAYWERRRELVEAAAKVFKEKGYAGARLGDIAAAMGTDRASLYYYVENKRELFHEVVRDAVDANVIRAEAIRDGAGSGPEKVRALIHSLMASYAEHHPYLFVYIQEDMTRMDQNGSPWAKEMRRLNKRYDNAVLSIVESGLADGSLRSQGSPRIIANGLIGLVNWSHRWYTPTGGPSPDDIADAYAEMVLQGLAPS